MGESFGFGADRQLHLFKNPAGKPGQEELQSSLCQGSLDQLSVEQHTNQRPSSPECSTTASGESIKGSGPSSPAANRQEAELPVMQGLPVVHVRNTFINLESDSESMDQRMVQSMPHGMFGQCIAQARQRAAADKVPSTEDTAPPTQAMDALTEPGSAFSPGALVIVEGLSKMPAFNGLSAVVQSWDVASERYNILIVSAAVQGGCQQAKVKEGNLRLVLPCP